MHLRYVTGSEMEKARIKQLSLPTAPVCAPRWVVHVECLEGSVQRCDLPDYLMSFAPTPLPISVLCLDGTAMPEDHCCSVPVPFFIGSLQTVDISLAWNSCLDHVSRWHHTCTLDFYVPLLTIGRTRKSLFPKNLTFEVRDSRCVMQLSISWLIELFYCEELTLIAPEEAVTQIFTRYEKGVLPLKRVTLCGIKHEVAERLQRQTGLQVCALSSWT